MKLIPIFVDETECKLWTVCYPEDCGEEDRDVFSILMDEQWSDVSFVRKFLTTHKSDLFVDFWDGLTVAGALQQIRNEVEFLDIELSGIEFKKDGYENKKLDEVFKPLHENVFSINNSKDDERKGKAKFSKPLLRLYGIALEDGIVVITGGAIKLTKNMSGKEFDQPKEQLTRVKKYLSDHQITDQLSLIEAYNEQQ